MLRLFRFLWNITVKDMEKNCCELTTDPQLRGFKEGLRANWLSSRRAIAHWKAYGFREWSDAAMLCCHLCMEGWLLRTHLVALNQTALLPCVRSTEIGVWSWEFIVVAIERLSGILPESNICNSGRWDGETGSKSIAGRSSGCSLRTHLLGYEMHLSDNYYRTWYSS